MLRRWAMTLLAITTVLALLPFTGMAYAAKDYTAERYDAAIVMQAGGALEVTETVVFRFMGGPFTYVLREIPENKTDGIEFVAASMDGVPFALGTQAGQVEVRDSGGEVDVKWHFAQTSDATHTFVLTYRALGVVFQGSGADVLEWDALPEDRSYAIGSSTVTLAYPGGLQPVSAPQVLGGRAQVATGDGRATFTAQNLSDNDTLTIGAQFPLGSIVTAQPQWQQRRAYIAAGTSRAAPIGLLAGGGVLLIGLVGLALLWNSQRRSDNVTTWGGGTQVTGTPPGDLPPALATALTTGGAQGSILQALAALFDLARRGVVRIVELEGRKWWGGRQYAIELLQQPSGLQPQELGLLGILFQTKKGPRTSVKLDEFASQYMRRSKEFTQPLEREMENRGLVDPARKQLRTRTTVAGFLAMGLGAVLAAAGLIIGTIPGVSGAFTNFYIAAIMIGGGAALFLVGISAVVVGSVLSPLTDRGDAQADQWRGFQKYLTDVTRGREMAPRLDAFDAYLPLAAGFGLLQQWGKAFSKQANAQVPAWFQGAAGSLRSTTDSFGAFAAMTAAMHSSATSAGGGAGGGAAGGGGSSAG